MNSQFNMYGNHPTTNQQDLLGRSGHGLRRLPRLPGCCTWAVDDFGRRVCSTDSAPTGPTQSYPFCHFGLSITWKYPEMVGFCWENPINIDDLKPPCVTCYQSRHLYTCCRVSRGKNEFGIFISKQIHFDLKFLSCLWLEACMVLLVPAQHRFCYLPVLIDSVFSRCFLVESGIFLVQLFYSNHIFRW